MIIQLTISVAAGQTATSTVSLFAKGANISVRQISGNKLATRQIGILSGNYLLEMTEHEAECPMTFMEILVQVPPKTTLSMNLSSSDPSF